MKIFLKVLKGLDTGFTIDLRKPQRFLFGRDREADFRFGANLDRTISRRQFVIEITPPLASTSSTSAARNGTFVNDLPVESAELIDGDEIRIGKTRLKLEIVSDSHASGSGSWSDLSPSGSAL